MASNSEYDLNVLLELRGREREEAEAVYAEALDAYHKAGEEVRNCEHQLRELVEERKRKCRAFDARISSGDSNMATLQEFDRHIEGLKDEEVRAASAVEEAQRNQHRAQKVMRKAHESMLGAIKALKAVEKHHQNWQKEQATTERRRQAAQMDDVAARLWREQHQ